MSVTQDEIDQSIVELNARREKFRALWYNWPGPSVALHACYCVFVLEKRSGNAQDLVVGAFLCPEHEKFVKRKKIKVKLGPKGEEQEAEIDVDDYHDCYLEAAKHSRDIEMDPRWADAPDKKEKFEEWEKGWKAMAEKRAKEKKQKGQSFTERAIPDPRADLVAQAITNRSIIR